MVGSQVLHGSGELALTGHEVDDAPRHRYGMVADALVIATQKGEVDGRLNTVLPIAFDGVGQLEVDLLCDDTPNTRIAVELDGDQHLADPAAYRRDRRKDLLLQENGYLVLRFLAQDVGRELGRVLDTILRALARGSRLRSGLQVDSALERKTCI